MNTGVSSSCKDRPDPSVPCHLDTRATTLQTCWRGCHRDNSDAIRAKRTDPSVPYAISRHTTLHLDAHRLRRAHDRLLVVVVQHMLEHDDEALRPPPQHGLHPHQAARARVAVVGIALALARAAAVRGGCRSG